MNNSVMIDFKCGMAMHLKLKKGRYKISLYTPTDQQNNFTYPTAGTKAF